MPAEPMPAEPPRSEQLGPVSFRSLLAAASLYGFTSYSVGFPVLTVAVISGHLRLGVLLGAVAVLGIALGVIETLEPTAMSFLRAGPDAGRGFGALGASRSIGAFSGNLVMGLLYSLGAEWSYAYAGIVGVIAGAIVLLALPSLRRAGGSAAGGSASGEASSSPSPSPSPGVG